MVLTDYTLRTVAHQSPKQPPATPADRSFDIPKPPNPTHHAPHGRLLIYNIAATTPKATAPRPTPLATAAPVDLAASLEAADAAADVALALTPVADADADADDAPELAALMALPVAEAMETVTPAASQSLRTAGVTSDIHVSNPS